MASLNPLRHYWLVTLVTNIVVVCKRYVLVRRGFAKACGARAYRGEKYARRRRRRRSGTPCARARALVVDGGGRARAVCFSVLLVPDTMGCGHRGRCTGLSPPHDPKKTWFFFSKVRDDGESFTAAHARCFYFPNFSLLQKRFLAFSSTLYEFPATRLRVSNARARHV